MPFCLQFAFCFAHPGHFKANFSLISYFPMMSLPARNLANVTSNFNVISYECYR